MLDDKYELILVEPNLDGGSEYKLTECSEAISEADIIAYLVAHKELKGFRNKENISLYFCGVKC
jgi:UDP-N-acetyl-D-mannosaminuronic acid dehydrogenase